MAVVREALRGSDEPTSDPPNLPEELLLHILGFLDSAPPSSEHATQTPLAQDLVIRKQTPLKRLRLSSKQWCRLVTPLLFRHIRITVEGLIELSHGFNDTASTANAWLSAQSEVSRLPIWFQLLKSNEPRNGFDSVVIYTWRPAGSELSTPDRGHAQGGLNLLLRIVRLRRLILLCPPEVLANLVDCHPYFGDATSFVIPYQRLELRVQECDTLQMSKVFKVHDYDAGETSCIFNDFHWQEVEYNAGSSLNAYGTYHYFEKSPPCIFFPQSFKPYRGLLLSITRFSYICVFPHNHHFNMNIMSAIREMCSLSRLEVRMAPDLSDNILNDTDTIGRGNLNLKDCWNEVERSYLQIISEILPSHQTLETFVSHDCRIPAFASTLDELWLFSCLNHVINWEKQGVGVFRAVRHTTNSVSDILDS